MQKFDELQKTHWKCTLHGSVYYYEIQIERNKVIILTPSGKIMEFEIFGNSNELEIGSTQFIQKRGDAYDYYTRMEKRGKIVENLRESNICHKYLEYLISTNVDRQIRMSVNRKCLSEECDKVIASGMNDGFILSSDSLIQMNIDEIKRICKKRKIRPYNNFSKDELIQKITKDQCSSKYNFRIDLIKKKNTACDVLINVQKKFGYIADKSQVECMGFFEVPISIDEEDEFLESDVSTYLRDDASIEIRCRIGNPKDCQLVIHIDEDDGYTIDDTEDHIINSFKDVKSVISKLKAMGFTLYVEVRTPWW